MKPGRSDRLPRLPLQKQEVVALFQRTLVNKWKKNKVQQAQEVAQEATAKWMTGGDPVADWEGNSDWGDVDPTVMAALNAAIGTVNAAW